MPGVLDPRRLGATRLTEGLVRDYLANGSWRTEPLSSHLANAVAVAPDRTAVVTVRDGNRAAFTYHELADRVSRVRTGLSGLGVEAGQTVSVMLPNSAEFAELIWAVSGIGAVYSGIPTSYGLREARFMLNRARAKVLVVPERHRGRDFTAFARDLRTGAPDLHTVIVVGNAPAESGWLSYSDLCDRRAETDICQPDPASLVHLGFTSGTTGEPKAVMNTHQTLDAVLTRWVAHVGRQNLGDPPVNLVCSPIGHHTGFLWGVLLTAYAQGTMVCLDRWDPAVAAQLIRDEAVTMMVAAPTFLQDLIRVPDADHAGLPSLRLISIPGAPIPRALVPAARDQLGCFICPAWGMTEYGIGISAAPGLAEDRIDATDGVAVPGCEVRVVDLDSREPVPPGRVGALEITGAGLFLGYLDRPDFTAEAVVDGWFRTGDLAAMSDDGFVTLHGRTKDIIIRGGENIPVIEVENLLYQHRAVLDAALIGVPDERLGERACAVLVIDKEKAAEFTLDEVAEHLLSHGLSKHFLPERLELVDELPKTMSGKIRKVELRRWLAGDG